jgi:hypothetical protein
MDHPSLSEWERAFFGTLRSTVFTGCQMLPPEQRGRIMLALVVELAEAIEQLAQHDTEPPPAPAPDSSNPMQRIGHGRGDDHAE